MNIKNKKNLIIFTVIFLLQLWFVPNVSAQNHEIDMNEIEEELPATDPFASGAGAASLDQSIETNELGSGAGIINNMKLVGTISGAHKKIAVLAMPDGRALKFEENEFATDNLQILEIYEDFIVIRVDAEDQFEVYMNNQIRPMEGN
jgi:hypothetical protein